MTPPSKPQPNEAVAIPLDPEDALRALLAVKPDDEDQASSESGL